MLNLQNILTGRINKASGDAFESFLEIHHSYALRLGILAHIEHNQPEAKMIHGRLIYTRQGVADYTGTLMNKVGSTLAVEAKSTSGKRLAKSVIQPRQASHLDAVAKAGGFALLLVEFRHGPVPDRYAIPWLEVPWKVARSAESVVSEDIISWQIDGSCYLTRFIPRLA